MLGPVTRPFFQNTVAGDSMSQRINKAQALREKQARLMAKEYLPFAFRLAALCAMDTRPGKVWS